MIAAFDLSLTATGYALWRVGGLDFGTVRPPKGMADCPRMDYIRREVTELARGTTSLVLMEDVAFSKNKAYAKEIAGLAWIIRMALWKAEMPYVLVQPSTLKKFATGSGKAEKNTVMLQVFRRFGVEAANDNEADAIGLCFLGRALLRDWEPTIEPQREVIAALRKIYSFSLDVLAERETQEVAR